MGVRSPPCAPDWTHKVSQGLTRSHKVPQGRTRSHKVSQGLTRSRKVPQGLTRPHKASQGLTRSHKAHPNAGLRLLSFGPGWKAGPPAVGQVVGQAKRGGSQVCSFSGWPLLGTLDHTYVAKTPPEHTFLLHCASGGRTALSSNSIKQHRVPAWPAGHPMESQHGLLVV